MEAKTTLWAITDDLAEVGALIAENGGELSEELEERLNKLEGELEAKVERIALFIRESEGMAKAAKEEKDRLHAIQKHHTDKAEGLKKYLRLCMEGAGKEVVETHRARVRVVRNSRPTIRWTKSVHALPDGYRRTTIAPDLSAALEDIDAGATPPEGFEVEHGTHIRIN